jgi:hypothetical protein
VVVCTVRCLSGQCVVASADCRSPLAAFSIPFRGSASSSQPARLMMLGPFSERLALIQSLS